MPWSSEPGRCLLLVAFVAFVAVGAACGARTGIEVEECGDGGMRLCETVCGAGEQICIDGRWQACVVPATERACDNPCGVGTQVCLESEWGLCEVPPAERACTDACGDGSQSCVDGAWQACRVPPAERACEGVCGPGGVQLCFEGAWQECLGPELGERACSNECGAGTQVCFGEVWEPCDVPLTDRPCMTACGEGTQTCEEGEWGRCSASRPRPPVLSVRVRDFHESHPDFESGVGSDRGIVEPMLGTDDKPVYAGPSPTTNGRAAFDQWYRDVAGVNLGTAIDLDLAPSPADPMLFVFDDPSFFPIDGTLFGNEGRGHNFHFTLEAETAFVYLGGEIFRFRGDDDVFVFINRRLAIDLGGVHGTEEATVDLDTMRSALGLVLGERYPIHLFFAERHTTQSTFTVETTVADSIRCD